MQPVIESAMATPDGWRVEVVRRGRSRWYRIVHGGDILDWLSLAGVQRILTEAGVDLADLHETPLDQPRPAKAPPGQPRTGKRAGPGAA